jgi:DNA-binding MarR family transcriptional regulator
MHDYYHWYALIVKSDQKWESGRSFSDFINPRHQPPHNQVMHEAYFKHGCRQKQIADHRGRRDTTTSNIIRKKA